MEVFIEARKSGRVRYLGLSAHSEEAALAAMQRYDFNSVLFPVSFATYYKGNFAHKVIADAKEKGMSILALKAMAAQKWPDNDPDREKFRKCWYQPVSDPKLADLALRFTLSQPVTAAIPPGEEVLFEMAVDLAMNFEPLSSEETERVKRLAFKMNPIFSSIYRYLS